MSDNWKTPSQLRLIGHLNDASGHSMSFSVRRDEVIVRHDGQAIRLRAAEREHFQALFMLAESEAEAWTVQNPDAATAEVCTFEAIHGDGTSTTCTFPGGHPGLHSFMPVP